MADNGNGEKLDPRRPTREIEAPPQQALFAGLEEVPDWIEHWWGMPSYEMGDARPLYELKVKFFTWDDVEAFVAKLGIKITRDTKAFWYPAPQEVDAPSDWEFVDE